MQEHIKPLTAPACPACGCRLVNLILSEPDPGETWTAPIGDQAWQAREPVDLVKNYYCKQCRHDQTSAINGDLPLSARRFRRIFAELGQAATRLRDGLSQ